LFTPTPKYGQDNNFNRLRGYFAFENDLAVVTFTLRKIFTTIYIFNLRLTSIFPVQMFTIHDMQFHLAFTAQKKV
jgi:hypothetical protein